MATQLRNVPGARVDSERQALHTPTRSRAALTRRVPIVGHAAIYTRVSTDRQQDGASLEVQLEECRRYCEGHGLSVVAEFRDVLSGLNPDRPQYQQAVALATSNGVDLLVLFFATATGAGTLVLVTGGLASVILGPLQWAWSGRARLQR